MSLNLYECFIKSSPDRALSVIDASSVIHGPCCLSDAFIRVVRPILLIPQSQFLKLSRATRHKPPTRHHHIQILGHILFMKHFSFHLLYRTSECTLVEARVLGDAAEVAAFGVCSVGGDFEAGSETVEVGSDVGESNVACMACKGVEVVSEGGVFRGT